MRELSAAARSRVTEPWEECVLFVYDDKRPKEHGRYPEWDGGAVRGTLTIGFGHTDAAGPIRIPGVPEKITQGMRITREQADEILSADLAPCERRVDRLLKVPVTQHQFDGIVDTDFNCPSAASAAITLINAGRIQDVPAKLLQYTFSKGEHMQGLVNRRNAEIAWFNHPDDSPAPAPVPEPDPDLVQCPKGERNPPPKSILTSKVGAAGGGLVSLSIGEAARAFNEMLEPFKQAKDSLGELGVFEQLSMATHNPVILVCLVAVGLGVFIIADRHYKLVNDHV